MEITSLAPLEPGTYFIDPDGDPSTSLRVVYTIPTAGWSQWIGAAKIGEDGFIGVSITTVTNVVRDGCRDHAPADPPVGPSVDDLAAALGGLAPFEAPSAPTNVTIYGRRGEHLELTVPDMKVEHFADTTHFTGCSSGKLMSWIAPTLASRGGYAFYGYTGPGYTEELWILDVDDSRLVISASWSPHSPRKDLAEMRRILESIRIEP
jgi:hypothetical protein